jgi:response regulator RpfG family c-di-GMP phosphodiesterase
MPSENKSGNTGHTSKVSSRQPQGIGELAATLASLIKGFGLSSNPRRPRSMKNKILLIDDDSSTRESLINLLRTERYEVLSAENRQQAVEQHGNEHVNLLLFSIDGAEGSSSKTMQWLSRIDRRLPVILLTKNSTTAVHLDPTTADVLMERPLNMALLLEKIGALINESAQARDARVVASHAMVTANDQYCGILRSRADTPYFCDHSNYTEPEIPATAVLSVQNDD